MKWYYKRCCKRLVAAWFQVARSIDDALGSACCIKAVSPAVHLDEMKFCAWSPGARESARRRPIGLHPGARWIVTLLLVAAANLRP